MTQVFQEAQMTLLGHRKLSVVFRNIQRRAVELGLEDNFNYYFTRLVLRMLKLRKGIAAADRIAKFVSVFVSNMVKEAYEGEKGKGENGAGLSPESPPDLPELAELAANFVDNLVRHLLRGIESRFKDVRFRIVQLLAYLVHFIPEIDEQLFTALQFSLSRRLHDKEPIVRIQAVVAMLRFQFGSLRKLTPATKALLHALTHDDSPEVRRAALLNITKNHLTLPTVLQRARDANAINRRLVHARVLKETNVDEIEPELREKLLSWGFHDRDVSVQQAATANFTRNWLASADNKILDLLEKLSVSTSELASHAMEAYFDANADKMDAVSFPLDMWRELTAEKAFLIRTFFDYCHAHRLYGQIEQNLPELTVLAAYLGDYVALRRRLVDANAEMVAEHGKWAKKASRFDQLLLETEAEQLLLRRKVAKETRFVAQYELHIASLAEAVQEKKKALAEARRQKTKTKDLLLDEEIGNLANDTRDLQHEASEFQNRLLAAQENIRIGERLLKEREVAFQHQQEEKERFLDESADSSSKTVAFMDQLRELEFVIEQVLLIIRLSDFADVAGTRKLQPLITRMLTNEKLPDSLIALSMDILRKLSIDEGYFSGLCIEIITDIRDAPLDENDQTFVSAASLFGEDEENDDNDEIDEEEPAKRRKTAPDQPPDEILTQCLMVLQHYLEFLEDSVSSTHQFDSLIETLIRPAMYSKTWLIRRLGVRCLGLVALLDEYLTVQNLKLFGQYASKMPDEELRILSTQIVFDLLSTHGVGILGGEDENAVDSLSLARLFGTMLKEYERPRIQAVVAEGLCKLFLADLMESFGKHEFSPDEEDPQIESTFLKSLLMSYFHPLNTNHQELQQVLAFCIPVYSFSNASHQLKLSMASGDCFYEMFGAHSKFSEFGRRMTPSGVLQQFIFWADPRNLVNVSEADLHKNEAHFWQVLKLLEVVEQELPKAVKKLILGNLHKFYLHQGLGAKLLRGLKSALEDTKEIIAAKQQEGDSEFVLDAPTDRSVEKFERRVGELLAAAEEEGDLGDLGDTGDKQATDATEVPETAAVAVAAEAEQGAPQTEDATAKPDGANSDNSDSEKPSEKPAGKPAEKRPDEQLMEIDRMLEEEANREYTV